MSHALYDELNSLEEFTFIGGSDYVLDYFAYDKVTRAAINLTGATGSVRFCPYGQPDFPVLIKSGVVSADPTNKFTVTLTANDTIGLDGTYIQQPIVVDAVSATFRPAQGNVLVGAGIAASV
jgi:hypothetical protein